MLLKSCHTSYNMVDAYINKYIYMYIYIHIYLFAAQIKKILWTYDNLEGLLRHRPVHACTHAYILAYMHTYMHAKFFMICHVMPMSTKPFAQN